MSIKKPRENERKRQVIGLRQGGKEVDGVFLVPCFYCGHSFTRRKLTFDHLKPKRDGGLATYPNLVLACYLCNQAREDGVASRYSKKLFNLQASEPGKYPVMKEAIDKAQSKLPATPTGGAG